MVEHGGKARSATMTSRTSGTCEVLEVERVRRDQSQRQAGPTSDLDLFWGFAFDCVCLDFFGGCLFVLLLSTISRSIPVAIYFYNSLNSPTML